MLASLRGELIPRVLDCQFFSTGGWRISKEDVCSLSTGRRGEIEWVARYYASIPDDVAKKLQAEPKNKKILQKTRTATLKSFTTSHAAFFRSSKLVTRLSSLLPSFYFLSSGAFIQ